MKRALSSTLIAAAAFLGASSPTLATPYSDLIVADNPLHYYQFSEMAGPTAVATVGSSGAYQGGANPSALGPQSVGFGAGNSATGFNGTDAFVSTPVSMSGMGSFAIEAWVRPNAAQGSRIGLVGQNDAQEFGFINGTTIELWNPSVGAMQVPYDSGANANKWFHIVAQGSGTQKQIYINGQLVGTQAHGAVANYGTSASLVNIGGGGIQDATGNFFNGQLDEVAIYNAPLTAQQIQQHYNVGAGPLGFGTIVVPGGGGKVSGTAVAIDRGTGLPTNDPVNWTLEQFTLQPGLQTQWYHNVNVDTRANVNTFLAGNPAPSVAFVSDIPGFGGSLGFPQEVIDAGFNTGNNRVVRWSGEIFIPESGQYSFKDGIDQSTQLFIDGQTVISDDQWAGFNGSGGDNGGSAINTATFNVAPGGEWLDFEFIMGEICCGNQATLYWDYDPVGGLGANADFPSVFTDAAGLGALIPDGSFRSFGLLNSLSGTGPFDGVFMDAQGNMIVFDPNSGDFLRLTVDAGGLEVFTTTDISLAVPEPATGALLLLGIVGLATRRRTQRQ